MRRRLAALSLLPLLLVGSAAPATAASKKATLDPGITINRIDKVVKYYFESWDPKLEHQEDSGSVRIDYTCRPGGAWRDEANLMVSITDPSSEGFQNVRLGDNIPCDGDRHRIDVPLGRWSAAPWTPNYDRVTGKISILVSSCLCGEEVAVLEHSQPIRIQYRGDWLPAF